MLLLFCVRSSSLLGRENVKMNGTVLVSSLLRSHTGETGSLGRHRAARADSVDRVSSRALGTGAWVPEVSRSGGVGSAGM
jgi:hypothetical protein